MIKTREALLLAAGINAAAVAHALPALQSDMPDSAKYQSVLTASTTTQGYLAPVVRCAMSGADLVVEPPLAPRPVDKA